MRIGLHPNPEAAVLDGPLPVTAEGTEAQRSEVGYSGSHGWRGGAQEPRPGLARSRVCPSSGQMEERGGEAEAGAGDELWAGREGTDRVCTLFPPPGPRLCQPSSDQQEA